MTAPLTAVLVHRNDNERAQIRAALESMPGVSIAGERSDMRAGMALARQLKPGILVLELGSSVADTLDAARSYKLEHPDGAIFLAGADALDSDTLLKALRAGASEVLRRSLDRGALSEAVQRVQALNARKHEGKSSRTILSVFSNKGGTGVSMIATNLALSLRKLTGQEVAMVDFDYHSGDIAFLLGVSPARSLADVLAAQRIDSASVQDALVKHESGVCVLAQPEQLDRVEGISAEQVGRVMEILSSTFEIVVVDAPHVFNEISLEIFDRSSTILLVAELSIPSVRAARRSLEIFSKLNYLATPDRVRLIVNRRTDQSAVTPAQLEETLGLSVFGSVSNDFAAVSQSINLGRPLCAEPTESRAARDLQILARELSPVPIEAENGAPEAAAPRRTGRLRLFGRG